MVRKLRKFDYFRPGTVAEALALLQSYQEKASILAGGTDLLVFMKQGIKHPRYVIDIKGIDSLDHITWNPTDGLRIGSLTTRSRALASSLIQVVLLRALVRSSDASCSNCAYCTLSA